MARREIPPQLLQEIRALAAGWGKIVARRAFGDQGPGLDTDVGALEQLARAAAAGLTEGALATLREQQAQALGEQAPCPDCGSPGAVHREPRTLAQEVGEDLARQRDAKAARGRRRVPARVAQAPALVAVEVDGGRLRTRPPGAGPGVHGAGNKEDKVACLVTLRGEVSAHDP